MIHELMPGSYDKVKALFDPLNFLPFCMGVIEGSHPGCVFVDSLDQPRTAFMLTWGSWGYLAGDPHNVRFLQALNEALMSKAILPENTWGLLLSCPPGAWAEQVAVVCAPRQPIVFPRRHYLARRMHYDWRVQVPEGYTLRRIDRSLLDMIEIALPEDVKAMAETVERDSTEIRKGCGFVALHHNQIAAQALIDCVVGEVGEIGFFTQENHRKCGLATVAAAAAIEYGLAHGLSSVVWDCYEYNHGSIRAAEKLGLVREKDHTMYCFQFDEANHLVMAAWHEADRGNYQETLEICERVFSMQESPPELGYISAARALAATGSPDQAVARLNQAVDCGWNYLPDFLCSEFDGLRHTPAGQALMARINP